MSAEETAVTSEVRQRILDAAAEAFMAGGFANATIDDIAREVGATKGLVYYHFRSKFDIFLAVYEEGMRRVRERVEPHARGEGTARERLVAMAVAHELNLMEDLAYHHVVHQAVRDQRSTALKARQRDALTALNRLRSDYEQLFRGVVTEGIEDGSLRRVDPALATRTLLSNLNAVDMWYHRVDGQPADEVHALAHRIVDLLIGGLAS
ncbi:AcrR family transcriptional regulator [Amycolatopsis bartoniae]|uniref:TetR family transcriptional regulator n=1 Tax=Amycolatopsis bartoniae TaxID=941986 RepID=A0A8H9MCB7_9PSEU|nr:TetR/AcrR family transcriptional regulator [Amycolatopsis bartoniae]MBB2938451.1 AcrR family transcriptional regulator [Amycolatopsis bartoniae]TVT10395.1 TetR/AcrR family transcriptional regulator [Amycolatopsis bartoniae]GHF70896.1 TetR family transcriptional regulator [Amycolatopsis bartoniae]